MSKQSRRRFLISTSATAAALGVSASLGANSLDPMGKLVAGGEVREENVPDKPEYHEPPQAMPSNDISLYVLLSASDFENTMMLKWQFATDEYFENTISNDGVTLLSEKEILVNISMSQVPAGSTIYYKLELENCRLLYKANSLDAYLLEHLETNKEQVELRNIGLLPMTEVKPNLFSLMRKETKMIDKTQVV